MLTSSHLQPCGLLPDLRVKSLESRHGCTITERTLRNSCRSARASKVVHHNGLRTKNTRHLLLFCRTRGIGPRHSRRLVWEAASHWLTAACEHVRSHMGKDYAHTHTHKYIMLQQNTGKKTKLCHWDKLRPTDSVVVFGTPGNPFNEPCLRLMKFKEN